jgi:hypothetical protein
MPDRRENQTEALTVKEGDSIRLVQGFLPLLFAVQGVLL